MAMQYEKEPEKISFEEYLRIVEKDPEHGYEYLDGRVVMMTGGSPDHSIIGANASGILRNLLKGRRCIVYNSDVYFRVSERYRVCPDAAVSCDPRDRGAKDAIYYPSLVIEILSPSTSARDLNEKSIQYRSNSSIQEFLLVHTQSPVIEHFRREKHGFWGFYKLQLGDTVELANLGISFSVAEIYEDTSLLEEAEE